MRFFKVGAVIPVLVFFVSWIHGATLGPSDDEAYYWVLAQSPALGYAFHPPGVAWVIAFFQALLGGFFGHASPALLRLPAALATGAMVALILHWWELAAEGHKLHRGSGLAALFSFLGLFGGAWMMVPDITLFFGWMLAFVSVWKICFVPDQGTRRNEIFLFVGLMLAHLSKYSAILAAFSAALVVVLWAPKKRKSRALIVIALAVLVGIVPGLIWNAQTGWGSLLYQIRDRHGGEFSGLRLLRFWAIEVGLTGPVLMVFCFFRLFRKPLARLTNDKTVGRFTWAWAVPAALVFFLQPAFGDFKPHWALIAFLPLVMEFSFFAARLDRLPFWMKFQIGWGIGFLALLYLMCHIPLISGSLHLKYPCEPE